jgi:hypothetical protein
MRNLKISRKADMKEDQVLGLAGVGFTAKRIAKEVYGSEDFHHRVGYVLYKNASGVTLYRNGKNDLGRSILAAMRREVNILDAIRSAGKQVTTALRKKSA